MAAPTNAANVKKALANSEPSTHGTKRTYQVAPHMSAIGGKADMCDCAAKCLLMTQSGHWDVYPPMMIATATSAAPSAVSPKPANHGLASMYFAQ